MSAELRLYPDRLGKVPRTGAVESVQEAELRLDEPASSVVNRGFLERAARAYWRLITRLTLGLIRVTSDGGDQCVVLIGRPFVLLRFHAPEYEVSEGRGSVIWRIKRGILVSREGRDSGSLRLAVAAADGAEGRCRVHVRMEVAELLSVAPRHRPVRTGRGLGVRADPAAHPPDGDPGVPAKARDDGRGGLVRRRHERLRVVESLALGRIGLPGLVNRPALEAGELRHKAPDVGAVRVEAVGLPDRVEHAVRPGVVARARHPLPVADVVGEVAVDQQALEVDRAGPPVDVEGLGEEGGDDQAGPVRQKALDRRAGACPRPRSDSRSGPPSTRRAGLAGSSSGDRASGSRCRGCPAGPPSPGGGSHASRAAGRTPRGPCARPPARAPRWPIGSRSAGTGSGATWRPPAGHRPGRRTAARRSEAID